MDPETKKLYIQLVEAGMFQQAEELIQAYNPRRQRTQGELGERGELLARGQAIGLDSEDLFVPEESAGSKYMADMGAGFVEQGLGAQQLVEHAIPGRNTQNIDQRVVDAERTYQESGLADEFTGGKITSYVAPAIGAGLLARTALAAAPLRTSALLGAAEETVQPVTGEDYWVEKGKDVAFGATVGLATEGLPSSMIRGTEIVADQPGRAYRSLQEPKPGDKPGWFRGSSDETDDILRVQEETGISFTPGQVTQSGGVQQVEELARSGLFTRNKVAQADEVRAGQYEDYIKKYRDSLGENAPIETIAPKVQAWGRQNTEELITKRHNQATEDYTPIKRFAGGQPIIPADNYANTLNSIMEDGMRAGASDDAIKAGKQAEMRLDRLIDQGGKLTGADVESLTRATDSKFSGNPFDVADVSFNQRLAGRIKGSVTQDIKAIPELADQLKKAKTNYKLASGHIDEFEQTLLGQVIGKEFASEIDDVLVNGTAPEKLFQKFRTASPTEVTSAFKHLDAKNPELANQFRASIIERARQGATFSPPAGGPGTDFDPATFLRNLGITGGGEKGLQGLERLKAMFPDNPEAVHSLYRAGLILGDKSMANTSKTAVTSAAREAFEMAGSLITGSIRKLAGSLGGLAGLRGVANSMDISQGFRVAPEPVNLGRTRRVHSAARIPALAATTTADDVEIQQ